MGLSFPSRSVEDMPHISSGNAELSSKLSTRVGLVCVQSSYFFNLSAGHFSIPVSFAMLSAAFCRAILAVIGFRAQKQMLGVYTRWIITMVANKHAFGYGALCNFPDNTMCQSCSTLFPELPMSKRQATAEPGPTGIRPTSLINMSPKALLNRAVGRVVSLVSWDVSKVPPLHMSLSGAISSGDARDLPTTTMAVSIRDAVVEIKRQLLYLIHIKSPSLRFGHTPDVSASRGLIVPSLYHMRAV